MVGGEEVVLKVQRPRIDTLVDTDLAAVRLAIQWLKLYGMVARRVDLDRLFDEFAATMSAELDFVAEGKNAERFTNDFAGDPGIYIAKVYWDYTTRRVLTLENVAGIKITDFQAIEAAGISRAQVARSLHETYRQQVFVTSFVHADPHPGNLFLRPWGRAPVKQGSVSSQAGVARPPAPGAARPFALVFVDFGMVATIPERLRASLRDYIIALGTRDSHCVVHAYIDSGVLLPGADRRRLEELHDVLFKHLEGVTMGKLHAVAMEQADLVWGEYRDILFEMPFQFPTDILFVARAVAILAGIASSLDPEFDPWSSTIGFAEKLASD